MKPCFKCGEVKELCQFYPHKKAKDGHLNKCKKCTIKDVREKDGIYDHTELGVIRVIYKTQKRNQRLRGFGDMPYTKKELSVWLYENNFKSLYDSWIASGMSKDRKPSIDRINDNNGYSFSNIKLVTWLDNRLHQYSDVTSGLGSSGRKCKALAKINCDGEVVCTYVSYSAAARDVGYSLEYQIKKSTSCRNGFFWKYIN